jgi:thiamine-phosphate pyrophosphorylase
MIRGLYGLYGMVDVPPDGAGAAPLCTALLDGGAQIVQLRMKGADARAMLAALEALRPICAGRAKLIVNDRLDVALAGGADGVHLGQDDLPLAAARSLAPPGFLVGISTHDEHQARAAATGGADYIGFGPVFPTSTKHNPDPVVGLLRLHAVCGGVAVPVVAIGGITLAEVPRVVEAGAAAAAIISAVNRADDVTAAARRVTAAFASR